MRPIKFRGRRLDNDNFVYGYFSRYHNKPLVDGFMVYPDSVAQLVGYDADGNEVYEGDEFTDKYGHTFTARLQPQGFCKDGHIRFDWMPHSCDFHTFPDDFDVEEDYINAEV